MTSIGTRLIGRLKAHGLFPVPTKPELSARFNRAAITEFLSDYHRLHGELLEDVLRASFEPESEYWIYLDPADMRDVSVVARHTLLAKRLVTTDPITMIPPFQPPPNTLEPWINQFRHALGLIGSNAELIRNDFLLLIPGADYFGVRERVLARIQDVWASTEAIAPWLSYGTVTKQMTPAQFTVQGRTFDVPARGLHWNEQFRGYILDIRPGQELDRIMKAGGCSLGIANLGGAVPRISTSFAGAMQDALSASAIRSIVSNEIGQYTFNLMMAGLWARYRLSSSYNITNEILASDITQESRKAVEEGSNWIPPARVALEALNIESDSVERILECREKHNLAFQRSVELMRDVAKQIQEVPADSDFKKAIELIVRDQLIGPIGELDKELRGATATALKSKLCGYLAISTVVGTGLVLAQPFSWADAAKVSITVGGAAAIPCWNAIAEYWAKHRDCQTNPLYFLWAVTRQKNARPHHRR